MANTETEPKVYPGVNITRALPKNWREDLMRTIRVTSKVVLLDFTDPTSREDDFKGRRELPQVVASGSELVERSPWIETFYKGALLETVSTIIGENAQAADDLNGIVTANVLGPRMRFEGHGDSWKLGANLYVKVPDVGGELVVARNQSARTYNEIADEPLYKVKPRVGMLSVVKLGDWPHSVTPVGVQLDESNRLGVLTRDVFKVPDLNDEIFWAEARIGLNFNLLLQGQTQADAAIYGNTYKYVHGKK